MKTVQVNALEWEALLNMEKMLRLAFISPSAGEFIAVAIQALDQVRNDEGIEAPEVLMAHRPHPIAASAVSDLAGSLIKRVMQK